MARSVTARKRIRTRRLLYAVVFAVALAFALFPLYYTVLAALDPLGTLGRDSILPDTVSWTNFRTLFDDPQLPFLRWLWNSLKISLLVAALSMVFTSMAAYAFSRFRFRGRRALMKGIVLVQVFPNLLALVAIFLMVAQLGKSVPALGLDSDWTLVLVYLGGVLGGNVWLMKAYLDALPRDLDESAMLDGASHTVVFWRILLPLARPMLAVIAVLSFVATYSELLLAKVLLKSSDQLTLPVGMYGYVFGQYDQRFGPFAAAALIAALPAVLLFYVLQDWLVRGLTQGAVKT